MSVDRFHSLPKKPQPTVASTYRGTITAARPSLFTEPTPCPEVAEFRHHPSYPKEQIYIHNLEIDYGRLIRPQSTNKKISDKLQQQLTGDAEVEMQTKRLAGVSNLLEASRINLKNTEKKINRNYYLDSNKSEGTPMQVLNVRYQQLLSEQLQRGKGHAQSKPKVRLQQVRAYEQVKMRDSGRKVLHSRIVKMVVGGGQVKTRMICYPDTADYMKLCGKKL